MLYSTTQEVQVNS